jgi:hypothetical protein
MAVGSKNCNFTCSGLPEDARVNFLGGVMKKLGKILLQALSPEAWRRRPELAEVWQKAPTQLVLAKI